MRWVFGLAHEAWGVGCGVWDVGWRAWNQHDACNSGYGNRCSWHHFRAMYGYHSLDAWKRAHAAVLVVLKALGSPTHPRTYAIFDQIRRATVSVAANIVEGYALGTTLLFRKHLRIAHGSAAEAEYLLRVAGELGYVDADTVRECEELLGGSMRAIYGLMRKLPRRFEQSGKSHLPHPTSHAV